MRQYGVTLIILGIVVVFWAFVMKTTVYNSPTYIGGSMVGGGDTHNLGLLQNQMMVLHTGLAVFLAGIFLTASSPAPAGASKAVQELTDEEREEREDRTKRHLRILLAVLAALIIGWFTLAFFNSRNLAADDSGLSGSVDENYQNVSDTLNTIESEANADTAAAAKAVDDALNAAEAN